jgi:hypothetical protein
MNRRDSRSRFLLGVVAFCLLLSLFMAATAMQHKSREVLGPADTQLRKSCKELTGRFADQVFRKDFDAAYRLMSDSYQDTVSLDQFISEHERAREQFGEPASSSTWIETTGLEKTAPWVDGKYYAKPDWVARDCMRAWVAVSLAVNGSGRDGSLTNCYELYLLCVEEDRELKVAWFAYVHCE